MQNEPNENDSEQEKFITVSLSNIRAYLKSLGEGIKTFDSLKKLDEYLSIYALKQKKSKHSPTLIEDVAH